MNGVEPQNGERLDSWKAIAAYLGRDEGTLRRWEQTRRLPIRRVPGRKGGSVYAFTAEVDAWLQSEPPEVSTSNGTSTAQTAGATAPPAARRWLFLAPAAAIAVIAMTAWWWIGLPKKSPAPLTIEVSEEAITAKDSSGSVAWVHRMGDASRHIRLQQSEYSRVALGSRPQAFVATEIQFRRSDNLVEAGRLSAFGLDGTPQWNFEFGDELRIGGRPFGAPWGLTAFAINDDGAARRIAVAAHHYSWSASLVGILDADGQRVGTYVNDGWLEALQWMAPDRLAVSGFSQSKNGGLVALLDLADLQAGAQSPEDDPSHQCENCGAGRPLRLAVMPRTELNRVTSSRFNRAILEHVGNRLIVRTIEIPAGDLPPAEAIYEFTPGLDFVAASFSEHYWQAHDRLFEQKVLDHDRARCPDRDGPRSMSTWSRDGGWVIKSTR